MVSGRPLLYLSLPGVAFILGVYWFRRRSKHRITPVFPSKDGNGNKKFCKNKESDEAKQSQTEQINSFPLQINYNEATDKENNANNFFGKSAPIQISRCSPSHQMQQKQQNLDSEALKDKLNDVEQKRLKSIDEDMENLPSSVDLPDSMDAHTSFIMRSANCKNDAAVVIKATNTPKISPENSFLESKYTTAIEPTNSMEDKTVICSESQQKSHLNVIMESKNVDCHDSSQCRAAENSSPSLSITSEQSGDSGKGSSLPRSEALLARNIYEFFLPSFLIGHLYGKKHSFIKQIKEKTSAVVTLSKERYAGKVRICKIEGTETEISAALNLIRQRLPIKRYPNFTMQRIYHAEPQTVVPLSNESLLNLQLNLIEGINNDVVVTSVITGGHIFVQHPLHPTHPSLALLQKHMYDSYSSLDAPCLPNVEINAVCVLPVNGVWYRVQILSSENSEKETCLVKFLDFGGFMYANFEDLRQIRSDFMGYPFQATECVLSNIEPLGGFWNKAAADVLCELTKGIVLQAQVAGYTKDNIPEVFLFTCLGPNNVIFINKELVARGLARWVDFAD